MSKLESQFRQNEIIKLAKRGPFDWKKLEAHLDRKSEDEEYNLRICKRTFSRDLTDIFYFYGITITYNFKTGMYELNQEESDEVNTELLESFDLIQAFQLKKNLKGKVFFEKRMAKGTEYLKPIFNAIEWQKVIQISYEKYYHWKTETRTLKPIALKQFKNRWYMFVWDENNLLKNFGLDRIRSLEIVNEQSQRPALPDLETRFAETFGVINVPEEPIETVILSFTEFKGRYIKSMPWHQSQTVLVDDGKVLTISLQLKINYELVSEILSHGDEVRVDAPKRLQEQVKQKIKNIEKGLLGV